MTNKEAIRVLKSTSVNLGRRSGKTAYAEALEMAITALQELDKNPAKPNNSNDEVNNSTNNSNNSINSKVKGMTACRVPGDNLISRQAAIDAVMELHTEHRVSWKDAVIDTLDALPSAQPEIIGCKDCKHRGEKPIADGRYWCELHGFMYYCSDAERRTDER